MQNSTLTKGRAHGRASSSAASGFLVYSSVDHAQHYKMVDELIADGNLGDWQGKELKLHGNVEAGSIVEKIVNQEQHRTFLLTKGGKTIRIFSMGPKPDTFKDASEVVATGHLVQGVAEEGDRRQARRVTSSPTRTVRRRRDRADGEVPVQVRRRAGQQDAERQRQRQQVRSEHGCHEY